MEIKASWEDIADFCSPTVEELPKQLVREMPYCLVAAKRNKELTGTDCISEE